MAHIITTYIAVLVLVSLGFLGIGAIASAADQQASTQPVNVGVAKNARLAAGVRTQPVDDDLN